MGSLIIKRILATEGITLSAAFDITNIGDDIGDVIRVGKLGVLVSDPKDLASVLKDTKTDVVLDFTVAAATAVNAPAAAGAGGRPGRRPGEVPERRLAKGAGRDAAWHGHRRHRHQAYRRERRPYHGRQGV